MKNMKESLLTPSTNTPKNPSPPYSVPYSVTSRLRPLLLPIVSSFLGAIVLVQALSFFFLYDRLEAVRIRLDHEASETGRREAFIIREVENLKGQILALTDDHSYQSQHYLQGTPPYPPPRGPEQIASSVQPTKDSTPVPEKDKPSGNRKARGRTKRRASDTSYGVNDGAARHSGELSVQLQGENSENISEADKSWLQLTSYARIPDANMDKQTYNAIQEFCIQTKESCPPGPRGEKGTQGFPGSPGDDGERGDRGLPGQMGNRGPQGPIGPDGRRGPPGVKGDIGLPGLAGLDGRDGLPGEPGLDGIPGRNGLNGIPGLDGMPGTPGRDGLNGTNGSDGWPGEKGGRGPEGPKGMRGLAGPRGRKGKDGLPGRPGTPGITAYEVKLRNGTLSNQLLVPPTVTGSTKETNKPRRTVVINEGDNLRLRCKASGHPVPDIEWSRLDGGAIPVGKWREASLNGHILNLTHVRREHTGKYECLAYNGIPPNDSKMFEVEVHFDPYIRVNQWQVGTFNGSFARLECQVEAFPVGVTYWEDPFGMTIDNTTKHRITFRQDPHFKWKSTMEMTITDIDYADFGDYHCVAGNSLSLTRGLVKVHKIDPTLHKPSTGTVDGLTFGPEPPDFTDFFELCPPLECKECPTCAEGRGPLHGIRVEKFGNKTYPGFKNRSIDCELSAVGKPVYHRHTASNYGSWMRDPHPKDPISKYWTTDPTDSYRLYEFSDKDKYRENVPTQNYTLPRPFTGNSHVIYNGSFYYHEQGHQSIIRYDLNSGNTKSLPVPEVATTGDNYLYNISHDYIDFNTDENGLWAIYGHNNNTVVMKINPWTLDVEFGWDISLSPQKFGELFITCGVLYAIDSTTRTNTKIRFALDLYHKRFLDVDLPFNNPFHMTTMLGYNPKAKEIYSWDGGNQLTYPIKYIDIGYNTPPEERPGGSRDPSKKFMDSEPELEVDPLSDT